MLPFIVSFLIAALLEPGIRRLRLRGYSRLASVALVYFAFFGALVALGIWLTPKMAEQVRNLTASAQGFANQVTAESDNANFFVRWNPTRQASAIVTPDKIDTILSQYSGTLRQFGLPTTKAEIMANYIEPKRPQIAATVRKWFDGLLGLIGSLAGQLVYVLLIPIITALILMNMEHFRRNAPKWIPPSLREGTMRIASDIYAVFIKYLRGVTIVVGLYVAAAMIVLSLLSVPYAIVMALLFGILYLIPYIGNVIVYVIIFSLLLFNGIDTTLGIHFGSPLAYAFIATAIFAVGVGLVFDQIIYPQLVGNSVGLNAVVSMFVILCGGSLFGIVGMLLAFPVAGSLKIIIDRLLKLTSIQQEELVLPVVPVRHRSLSGI